MNRIPYLDPRRADGYALELLDGLEKRFGHVPDLFRALAQSPAALGGLIDLERKLRVSNLPDRLRTLATLRIAEVFGGPQERTRRRGAAIAAGWSEEGLSTLLDDSTEGLTPAERAVLRFSNEWTTAKGPGEGAIAEVTIHLQPGEIVDLTLALSLSGWTARFGEIFGIDSTEPDSTRMEKRS